jgi:carnitine O-palmitoyltransferase 1
MINSNYYVLDSAKGTPTPRQTARAAQMLTQLLEARRLIDHEQLEPMVIRDTVPMCMQQYGRMFNTTRIPGHEIDTLEHFPSSVSRHVIVARHGSFYILKLYHSDGTVLSTLELESQLEWIKRDGNNRKDTVDARERALPALTALKRTAWAEARLRFFSSGKNQSSLSRIDTAMCFLVLDDMAPEGDTARANRAFHGLDGQLVWLDKSFSLIVFENGRYAINVEHSWADAPVIGHVMEIVTGHERNTGYAENGCNLRPPSAKQSQHKLKTPSLLEWELDGEEIGEVMDEAVSSAAALIGSLQLQVTTFREFGKGTIKRCKVSPDAFFQLALQMAYREDVGKFDLTYESSMTRLFRGGRTETVRSVTAESVAFVEAMRDPSATREQRLALMNKAADAHQELYRLAMTGGGVDRHLFALYVVSKGKSVQSAFLNEALGSSLWRLSTSQQPQGQASKLWDMRTEEHQAYLSPGGGFGPVADDGYGVSYMLAGENVLFWHVSAKANSRVKTSAENLSNLITKSLLELRELCQPQ